MENCRRSCFWLHFQSRRVFRKLTFLLPQVGQLTPSGQRIATSKANARVTVSEITDRFNQGVGPRNVFHASNLARNVR